MRPARISLAPVYITPAPTSPRSTVEERERAEVVASVRNTLSRMRRIPPSKTAASRPSAWYPFTTRTPPSDSVRRPVTSAYICPRSRNTGRSTRNPRNTTRPKATSATRVRRVTRGLIRSITVKARVAVSRPPASSIRPVPTRFRKPSTSFMIRDTRSPVLFASWNAIGRRPTCSWTRIRMSAISCCAAFETSCTSAKEPRPCTTVAATTAADQGQQQLDLAAADDVVDQVLGGGGQDQPRHPAHGHEQEGHGQQPPPGLHEGPDVGQQRPQPLGLPAPGRLPGQPRHDPGGSPHLGILPRRGERTRACRSSLGGPAFTGAFTGPRTRD